MKTTDKSRADALTDPLPCPFCGSDEVTVGSFGSSYIDPQHYVQCEECDGATVRHASDGEAIAAWNRRAPVEQHEAAPADDYEARQRVAEALGITWPGTRDGKRVGYAWSYLLGCIKDAERPEPAVADERAELVRDMVNRFLGWKLPDDFAPDAGIKFVPPTNPDWWPVGTNLLTADQAAKMIEHILPDEARASSPNAAGAEGAAPQPTFDERREFEVWARENGYSIYGDPRVRDAYGGATQSAWRGWMGRSRLTDGRAVTLLRQARDELNLIEWENDPPNRIYALFGDIDKYVSGTPAQAAEPVAWETTHPAVCTPITKEPLVAASWREQGWHVAPLCAAPPPPAPASAPVGLTDQQIDERIEDAIYRHIPPKAALENAKALMVMGRALLEGAKHE
ncbi:Lar family restriction alleviation protein [Burkholderia ambifaria]|uniref:Lar family restriction alleviation protein n=1 Tax=Burkholderia ambifaria TaxID=152480 RepID=UPI001E657CB2|nr:Lar family restriction alleviation protein [Burkholderia ambifaria]UEP23145.1 Lar family restriction alleviation protein [Burkholderia ambifaria]